MESDYIDIHNYDLIYKKAIEYINRLSISERNKKMIFDFDRTLSLVDQLSIARRVRILNTLAFFAKNYLERDFDKATKEDLKKAIGSDKIQAKHGLLLNQYYKKFGSRVNLDNWVARISEKGLSSEDLKKELAREVRGVKKTKKFFEKRKDGFRLFPMSFDPKKTLDEDKEKMKKALKSALDML